MSDSVVSVCVVYFLHLKAYAIKGLIKILDTTGKTVFMYLNLLNEIFSALVSVLSKSEILFRSHDSVFNFAGVISICLMEALMCNEMNIPPKFLV